MGQNHPSKPQTLETLCERERERGRVAMGDVFPPRSNANPRRLGPSGSSVMPGPAMKIDSSGEDDQLMSPALALPPPPAALGPSRKRKKTDDAASGEGGGGTGSGNGGGEPRRLRRSHEACARCRAKKIKVSSSHPSSILADVRRRPSVFAALTGYSRRFPAKIINRNFTMHPPSYILLLQRVSLSCFTHTHNAFSSVTRSIHDAVPVLLQASSANKKIAIGTCIIFALHERLFS